ncbi:MAG: recombination protein O N-terminal domain-containing protein, partial [Planctomycetes bacterium]|nr:recombination protein O N-terminal domain-containing protein [Planctomycetota bacterium]
MGNARVYYQDAYILRVVPWTEGSQIISLLSPEQGLFTALWQKPKTTKPGKDNHPQLFESLKVALQKSGDHRYKIRSFEELEDSYRVNSLKQYLGLNLLARILLLTTPEAPGENLICSLWRKYLRVTFEEPHTLLYLLADIHFSQGTWPSMQFCESCHQVYDGPILHEDTKLQCQQCASAHAKTLQNESVRWLSERYHSKEALLTPPPQAKALKEFL